MKKMLWILIVILATVPMAKGAASDDYKVIRKAVKPGVSTVKTMSEARWFKLEVSDMNTGKVKVRITLPLSLIDVFSEWCPKDGFEVDKGLKINLKQLVRALKKVGPLAIVEACEDNEKVKIWVE